jgi:ribosomal protein S18 acetylase RimI-like enzyme
LAPGDGTGISGDLCFRTIDLARDAEVAVAFRRDSYVCSFGSADAFGDPDSYLDWLRERIAQQPRGHVHLWQGESIIGQLEMAIQSSAPVRAYVNLFYLAPTVRGHGFGDALHHYAVELMRAGGVSLARLSVSPNNARAISYYLKHAWRDLGPRPDDSSVRLMELCLEPGSGPGPGVLPALESDS